MSVCNVLFPSTYYKYSLEWFLFGLTRNWSLILVFPDKSKLTKTLTRVTKHSKKQVCSTLHLDKISKQLTCPKFLYFLITLRSRSQELLNYIVKGSMILSRDLRRPARDTSKLALHSKGIQFREDNAKTFPPPSPLPTQQRHDCTWHHHWPGFSSVLHVVPGGRYYILLLFQYRKSEMTRGAAGTKLLSEVPGCILHAMDQG